MGKQPSGAANRRAKREREDAERREFLGLPAEGDDTGASAFAELGAPDLEHPESGLEYTRKVLLVSLHQIATDPGLTSRERHRMVKETAAAIGLTHPKAAIEASFKKLQALREKGAEPEATPAKAHHGIARPPTARGYRPGGGAGEVPRPLPDPDSPPDAGGGVVGGGDVGPAGSKVH